MSSNTTSDASIGRLSHLERTVQSLPLSAHHDNEPFQSVLWPCIQQCIPIERISKLFPPLHEMNQMRLYHRLFEELERFNYNPDVLKDLRSRGRERFTLRGLFTYIHIDYSEVMSHFQTNPQDREDLEAYILASGLVMNRIRRPDTWSNVYPTTNAIKTRWEEFANESLSSLIDLVHFSNIMNYALKYISAIGNQQRLLTICACLAEGPRHARYVTGSAQSSRTSNRVLIYRTLSNTTKIARPKRKEKNSQSQSGSPGSKKRPISCPVFVPAAIYPTDNPLLPTPPPVPETLYRPLPKLLPAFRPHINIDLPVSAMESITPESVLQYRQKYMRACDSADSEIVHYDCAPPIQATIMSSTEAATSPTLEAIDSLQYLESDIASPPVFSRSSSFSPFRSIFLGNHDKPPIAAPAMHPAAMPSSLESTPHSESPLAFEYTSLKRRRLLPPTHLPRASCEMEAMTDEECSKSSRSNSSIENVNDYFVLTTLAMVCDKQFCDMSDVDIRVKWNDSLITGQLISYTATEFELPIENTLLWEDVMLMLAVEIGECKGTVLLNGDDVKSMIVSQNPSFWLDLNGYRDVSLQISLKVLHK